MLTSFHGEVGCWHPFMDGQNSSFCAKKSYMYLKKEFSWGILDVPADKGCKLSFKYGILLQSKLNKGFSSWVYNIFHIEAIIHFSLLNNFSFGILFIFLLVPHTDALEITQKWKKITHFTKELCICIYQCVTYVHTYVYMCMCVCVLCRISRVQLSVTLLCMGLSRYEYWSGLQCPPPGDLPDPEIEPTSLISPTLAGEWVLYHSHHLGSLYIWMSMYNNPIPRGKAITLEMEREIKF